ncbi:hypothetical protein V8E36_006641 [Tilletia maclaganii]
MHLGASSHGIFPNKPQNVMNPQFIHKIFVDNSLKHKAVLVVKASPAELSFRESAFVFGIGLFRHSAWLDDPNVGSRVTGDNTGLEKLNEAVQRIIPHYDSERMARIGDGSVISQPSSEYRATMARVAARRERELEVTEAEEGISTLGTRKRKRTAASEPSTMLEKRAAVGTRSRAHLCPWVEALGSEPGAGKWIEKLDKAKKGLGPTAPVFDFFWQERNQKA